MQRPDTADRAVRRAVSILGTTYGGNGVSTFCLPDFRGRVPNHSGQGPGTSNYVLGEFGGSETVTLTLSQMPGHNHLVTADGTAADTIASNPADHFLGPTGLNLVGARDIYSKSSPPLANPATMNAQMIGVTGGSQPHPNLQPYLTVTFLIAMVGIFPSRN